MSFVILLVTALIVLGMWLGRPDRVWTDANGVEHHPDGSARLPRATLLASPKVQADLAKIRELRRQGKI